MKKTVSFTKNASNIFFHILTQCNLKCRHCYINPDQHGNIILDIEVIKKWLGVFAKKCKNPNVIFLGGEPTLHPHLSEAVRFAKKTGYTSVTIDTNGYLFHDILEKTTPDDLDFISFSLDGPTPETNDSLRGKGSFAQCTAGIKAAKKKGFSVSLIYTVSSANLVQIEKMPELLEDLGVDRFFIQVIGMRGKPAEKEKNNQDIEQVSRSSWMKIVPNVADTVAKSGIVTTYPKVFLAHDEVFECAGLVADNYFIFPNGRVYRCPLCEDFPLHSLRFEGNRLCEAEKINEADLFPLSIPEGCVMNKMIQPDNLSYDTDGNPEYKVACCMLKEKVSF